MPTRRQDSSRKKVLTIKLTTKSKTGADIALRSKKVDGWFSLTLSKRDTYSELYYYGSNDNGGRSYKSVTLNKKETSPGIKIKASDKTNTIRFDGWAVTFRRPSDYAKVVDALKSSGFLDTRNTFVMKERS